MFTKDKTRTNIRCVTIKVHPFYFSDYLVNFCLISVIFGNIAAEKICNQIAFFLMIFSLCNKNARASMLSSVRAVLSGPLLLRLVSFSQFFFKSLFSPCREIS